MTPTCGHYSATGSVLAVQHGWLTVLWLASARFQPELNKVQWPLFETAQLLCGPCSSCGPITHRQRMVIMFKLLSPKCPDAIRVRPHNGFTFQPPRWSSDSSEARSVCRRVRCHMVLSPSLPYRRAFLSPRPYENLTAHRGAAPDWDEEPASATADEGCDNYLASHR